MERVSLALLQVEHLVLAAGPHRVVDDVSFGLAPGEIVGLVGESGSGKTMVARAAIRLLPEGIRAVSGRIVLDGTDLAALPPQRMRRLRGPGMGMVFQEPMTSLNPAMTVGDQLAEGLRLHGTAGAGVIRARCLAMLERVRIRDPEGALGRHPHEFSGGMRQRIMLASTMLLRPRLLIADEPTTALDMLSQREVMDLMVELARAEGSAVLLITHDLGLVERYADRAVVMCRGRLVEQGPVSRILRSPAEPYTRSLVEATHRRAAPRAAAPNGETVLDARDIRVRYAGRRTWFGRAPGLLAVCGVSVAVRRGEMVAVVGASGSGKTTLGRAVLGLVPIEAGRLAVLGKDLADASRAERHAARLACQLIFQDPQGSLDPRMRVAAIVAEPLRHVPGIDAAATARRVDAVLDRVGLSGLGGRHPHALSGGQRQRVAVARAVVRKPALIVADEPVSALDLTIRCQVLDLFRELQAEYGFACLFISHDLAAVEQVADRILVMQDGAVVEQGDCPALLREPRHPYTRALVDATPVLGGRVWHEEPAP